MEPLVVRLSDSVTIINADCRDVLPVECDAVVTDPPYGFNYDPNRNRTAASVQRGLLLKDRNWRQIQGESEPFDPAPLLCAKVVLLWGANHYADKLPSSRRWLVWDKRDGVASDNQSDCELAWCNVGGSVRMHRQLWRGIARAGEENIATSGEKLHPHQKPVALMAWCLSQLPIAEGETVCDPYMGSGSTGIACIRTGRKFIGIEKDARYFEIARKRLEKELRQGLLPLTFNADWPKETL
jgi:DNA modification methylase